MTITVSPEIESVCPGFVGAAIEAHATCSPHSPGLWAEIDALCRDYASRLTTDHIKHTSAIEATRRVYRACGKDPSRYRPSAEALIRRVLQGKALHQVNTLVDMVNLASMAHGYSIGGFDADKIAGTHIELGIGREGEPYEGIGRGPLNIASLPVYRDAMGGIGTPTSDHERTKMTLDTTHVLFLINGYDGSTQGVEATAQMLQELLRRYAQSDGGTYMLY